MFRSKMQCLCINFKNVEILWFYYRETFYHGLKNAIWKTEELMCTYLSRHKYENIEPKRFAILKMPENC